jgi:putative membrane protein
VTSHKAPQEVEMGQKQPDLGVIRTLMAGDRTLMAWIRTSLSMLSFGYTIYNGSTRNSGDRESRTS